MTKRVLTAAASVLLCAPFLLAGCSGGGGGTAGGTVTVTAEPTSTAPSTTAGGPSPTPGTGTPQVPEPGPDLPAPDTAPVPDAGEVVGSTEYGQGRAAETAPTGPQLGDQCIGADIGRTSVGAGGTPIMCDNYVWQVDNGQTPSHPWVDGQIEWGNCIAEKSAEECRAELN